MSSFANASSDNGQVCKILIGSSKWNMRAPISAADTETELARVFGDRLPPSSAQPAPPPNIDPSLILSGAPNRLARIDVRRFARSARDPNTLAYRVPGEPNVYAFLHTLLATKPASKPDPRRQKLGLMPALITVAGFGGAALVGADHTTLPVLIGLGGLATNLALGFNYFGERSTMWHELLIETADRFRKNERRDEVALVAFKLRLPVNDLQTYPAEYAGEITWHVIEKSPTERGMRQYFGDKIMQLLEKPVMRDLEFWIMLYYDHNQQEPVLVYGIPG